MSENEKNGFKMFEKPPPGSLDPKAFVGQWKIGIKEHEKVYGPVFTSRMIEHVLRFLAERIGEKRPEDIKTSDQMAEYLLSRMDRYPKAYCALTYAQFKTERELQGQVGVGQRMSNIGWQRKSRFAESSEKVSVDLGRIMSDFWKASIALKLCPLEFGYRTNEDGGLDVLLPSCFYKDGCQELSKEGLLTRPGGGIICNLGVPVSVYLRAATGYEWDCDCLEYDKPHCIIRYRAL